MALSSWPPAVLDRFQNSGVVPIRSPPDLSELADHLLCDAPNDGGPSGLRGGDDGLHLRGHSIRRAGPDQILRRRLPEVSQTSGDDSPAEIPATQLARDRRRETNECGAITNTQHHKFKN